LGISKAKSQLRQAKRLLSRQGLTSEVRLKTNQKINELESYLSSKPSKEQERKNAQKYHGIKFFDRRKVTRSLKRALAELEKSKGVVGSDSKIIELEERVERLRIDLNYVLHYPNRFKYISIYPAGRYVDHPTDLPTLSSEIPSTNNPDRFRNYLRAYVSEAMRNDRMSLTPEKFEHHHHSEEVLESDKFQSAYDGRSVAEGVNSSEQEIDEFFSID
ncbi:hypothetical protein BY996DRAFT_4575760, partial [Phakopsora pachyrhizi]